MRCDPDPTAHIVFCTMISAIWGRSDTACHNYKSLKRILRTLVQRQVWGLRVLAKCAQILKQVQHKKSHSRSMCGKGRHPNLFAWVPQRSFDHLQYHPTQSHTHFNTLEDITAQQLYNNNSRAIYVQPMSCNKYGQELNQPVINLLWLNLPSYQMLVNFQTILYFMSCVHGSCVFCLVLDSSSQVLLCLCWPFWSSGHGLQTQHNLISNARIIPHMRVVLIWPEML